MCTKTSDRLRKYHNLFAKVHNYSGDHLAFLVGVFRSFRHPRLIVFSPFHLLAGLLGGLWGEKRWKINWPASAGDGKSGGGQVCYFYVFITALSSALLMVVAQAQGKVWWPCQLLLCIAAQCSCWWRWPKQRAKWGWPRRLGRHSIDGH